MIKNKQYTFIVLILSIFLLYFLTTTVIYIIALNQGNLGISLGLFGGGDDGYFYFIQANNFAIGEEWIRTSIYPLIIGYLIRITGIQSVYLIRIFNFIGLILLVFVSIKMIKYQFDYAYKKISIDEKFKSYNLLVIFFIFYLSLNVQVSMSIYRDIWIYLFYVLSTLISSQIIITKKNNFLNYVFLIISLSLLYGLRPYSMLSFIVSVTIFLIFSKFKLFKHKVFLSVFLFILFLFYYVFLKDFTLIGFSLERALNFREIAINFYNGGSQMFISLKQSNVILFLYNYIYSYLGNLIGPFPWHISSLFLLIAFLLESIPMIFILVLVLKKRFLLNRIQKYFLLHSFIWIGFIGITNDNIGTATRLRVISWILIIIVYLGFFVVDKKKLNYIL